MIDLILTINICKYLTTNIQYLSDRCKILLYIS